MLIHSRGAGASKGHTSWSSKPEQDDYLSFVGFLLCYMDELHQNTVNGMGRISGSEPMSEQVETPHRLLPPRSTSSSTDHNIEPSQGKWTLVLGGYSYGSQIVRHLPELSTILKQFNKPEYGTTASEIRLRAKHLADERARYVHATISRERTSPAASSLGSPVYGGDESQPGSRRVSRESRRSMDKVRKAVDHSLAHFSKKHKQLVQAPDSEPNIIEPERPLMIPEVRYLLISPLLPPLSGVLALSTRWFRLDPASEERLRDHHTLAIWGSDDFFTSSKRLTRWATSLQKHNDGSMFEFREVQDAGHFWLEDGTETELGQCLRSWLGKLDTR